jgi:hypothetical protein
MAAAILTLGFISVVVGMAILLVFGGGFRAGSRGHPEGHWGRSGQRIGGGMSPPLMLVSGLVGFGGLLLLVALLMAVA